MSRRVLPLLADGVLLLGLAAGTLGVFFSIYPLEALDAAPIWAAGLLLCLASLALWSFRPIRLPGVAVGALALLWALRSRWETFAEGAKLLLRAMVEPMCDKLDLFNPFSFVSPLRLSERSEAMELAILFSLAFLILLLGGCVVCLRRWWVTAGLTLLPLIPGLLTEVRPHWASLLLLLTCWGSALFCSLCREMAGHRRAGLTLTALAAVGLLLGGLTLALPSDGYVRPEWVDSLETSLVQWGSDRLSGIGSGSGLLSGGGGGSAGGSWVGYATTVDLSDAGPRRYRQATVLRVTSEGYTADTLYLRGAALTHYTGSSWEALSSDEYASYLERLDDAGSSFPHSPLLFPAYSPSDAAPASLTVHNIAAPTTCVYVPYQLIDQEWNDAGLRMVMDSYVARRDGEYTHTIAFRPETGVPSAITDFEAALAQSIYSPFAARWYADTDGLPELDSHLKAISGAFGLSEPDSHLEAISGALGVAGLSSNEGRLAMAAAVAAYLDEQCSYSLIVPYPPAGEDFVTWFLEEQRQGYCVHFASAATVLLRWMGVPARYVSGYVTEAVDGERVDVLDSDAHAWVEIYLDGYGWYPVEVTPAADPVGSEPDPTESPTDVLDEPTGPVPPRPSAEESPSPEPSESADAPSPSAEPTESPSSGSSGSGTSSPAFLKTAAKIAAPVLCVAGAALALWLGHAAPIAVRERRLAGKNTNRAVLTGYGYLIRLKRWGGRVEQEALDLARKAKFSQYTISEEERRRMAGLFLAERRRLALGLTAPKRWLFRYLWGG